MTKPRILGICLFYNDDDIAEDAIRHLLENNHDLIVFDHGSTDGTAAVIDRFAWDIRQRHFVPRSFDFYKIFEHVSRHVIANLASQYDWISFPESDEFLEGPDRSGTYYQYLCDAIESPYDWIQFDNYVFWFTEKDDPAILSPRQRIKHYSVWRDCPPRVYSWRASKMNIREFNHNPALGLKCPENFITCHYQFRSEAQMEKRIRDRQGLAKDGQNVHFDAMEAHKERLRIPASRLHFDDGVSSLDPKQTINWREIYS